GRAGWKGEWGMGAGAIGFLDDIAPANAVAAQLAKQAPGFYRYKVGSLEVTVVTDGARSFPLPDNFVNNAYRDQINAALEQAFMPRDKITLVFNPIVVNTGSKLIVIDTGYGAAEGAQLGATHGQFQKNLPPSPIA